MIKIGDIVTWKYQEPIDEHGNINTCCVENNKNLVNKWFAIVIDIVQSNNETNTLQYKLLGKCLERNSSAIPKRWYSPSVDENAFLNMLLIHESNIEKINLEQNSLI